MVVHHIHKFACMSEGSTLALQASFRRWRLGHARHTWEARLHAYWKHANLGSREKHLSVASCGTHGFVNIFSPCESRCVHIQLKNCIVSQNGTTQTFAARPCAQVVGSYDTWRLGLVPLLARHPSRVEVRSGHGLHANRRARFKAQAQKTKY